MLEFFKTGASPVPSAETIEIAALLDTGLAAWKTRDVWVTVKRQG
jgi:hypothetical protein